MDALSVFLCKLWEVLIRLGELLKCIAPSLTCMKCTKSVGEESSLIAGLPNYLVLGSIIPKVVNTGNSHSVYRVMNDLRSLNTT